MKLNTNKTEYYKLTFEYEFYIFLPSSLKVKFCDVIQIFLGSKFYLDNFLKALILGVNYHVSYLSIYEV